MKLRIGPFFAESGRAQDRRNLVDIRNALGKAPRVYIGLLAESFDSALSFNIHVTEFMMRNVNVAAVELRGWNVRQLCKSLDLSPEFLSRDKIVYLHFPLDPVSQLFNTFWLASNIRILGLQGDFLYNSDIWTNLEQDMLPQGIDFIIEKKSAGVEDFLCIQCDNLRSISLVAFLQESSTCLEHPLVAARIPI